MVGENYYVDHRTYGGIINESDFCTDYPSRLSSVTGGSYWAAKCADAFKKDERNKKASEAKRKYQVLKAWRWTNFGY